MSIPGITSTGHKTTVEVDRYRVSCLECAWFHYATVMSVDELRQRGYQHRNATKDRK